MNKHYELFDKGYAIHVVELETGKGFFLQGDDATQFRAERDEAFDLSLSKFLSLSGYDALLEKNRLTLTQGELNHD